MAAKHDSTPYKGHIALYSAGFITALFIFIGALLLALPGKPTGWEYSWFQAVNNWPGSWDGFMAAVTTLGSVWMVAAAVVVAFFVRFYRFAWRLALTSIGALGTGWVIKHLVGRERPGELFGVAHERIAEVGLGFPSLHATAITVIMLTLLPYMPWKWRWIVPVLIIAVALSRLYLGVHLPLDVIGGIALGTAAVAAVRIIPQSFRVLLRID